LNNEPVLNFQYRRKRRLWDAGKRRGWSFDGAGNVDTALGNAVILGEVSLEMRFGWKVHRGHCRPPPGR
jgi:hypothetical protein